MAKAKRRDKSRVVLRTGESQRADGTYHYCWTDANRKRRYVYAKTLDELRYKEEQIEKDKKDGIKAEARYTTLNDIYELWKDLKHSLWKRKDRSCLIFIAKLLWTDILILSFLTVLDSRNINQPLTKQYVVLSVTAMMNSS